MGVLRVNKQVFCCTLELPDLLNLSNKSSIPAQQYICQKTYSPKFNFNTFEVLNVPNRSNILFHPGNTKENSQGCILLGDSFGKLGNLRAVLNSGDTFKGFMSFFKLNNNFHLTVKEIY